jgi:glyoxylate reductase
MNSRPKALLACALPDAGLDLLRERFDVETLPAGADGHCLLEHAPGTAAIIADPSVAVSAQQLDAAGPSLKVVSNFGVGYDNFELDALRARSVRGTNTPDVVSGATAELAVALMLAASRRIAEADATVRRERSTRSGVAGFLGRELTGATVGVIGFGRIGQRVAELLSGFEVTLLYASNREAAHRSGATRRELPDILAAADFITLHVPLTARTRHLIGRAELAVIKPGAILVNTSRGGVVDTGALINALRTGRVAAAGLDVYEDEPDVPDELCRAPNTVLLPHIGSATAATRAAMARLCAANAIAVIEGREPPTAVV